VFFLFVVYACISETICYALTTKLFFAAVPTDRVDSPIARVTRAKGGSIMKRVPRFLFALALLAVFPVLSRADTVILGTEDPEDGFVGAIATSAPPLLVASDGEGFFDPFNAGFDTSDGIQLNSDWVPDPRFAAAFGPGLWTQIPGTFTWVLPELAEGTVEPIAKWNFPGALWNPGTPDNQLILGPTGFVSDIITVDNTGPNGEASITFQSGVAAVPEPASLTLLGIGLIGLAAVRRLRRKSA
jgi:hypothetical protein